MDTRGVQDASERTATPGSRTTGYRILGRTFDRLSLRLGIGFALLVIGPVAVAVYALSRYHFDQTIEARRRATELQGRILEAALRHQMMEKDPTLLPDILDEIGAETGVRNAMILDHQGEVRISSQPERLGDIISQDSRACFVCHAQEPEERERWAFLEEEGGVFRSVLPIENRVECHACHDPEERLNGILILDVSMTEVQAGLERDLTWIVLGTSALALALMTGMGFLMRRVVFARLARLGRTARSITAGNLTDRAPVEGDDVITSLSRDFNDMAQSVSGLFEEVRDREHQLTSVMNSLDDGLLVLDADLRVMACNRSLGRRLATHPTALRGIPCGSVGLGEHRLPCCASDDDCPAVLCRATGRVQRAIYRTPDQGGDLALVEEVYASPVFDANGEVAQVVELWRDIGDRVREEERLAEIERMVSLGALASGFSHEVNTPLASMLTCAESVIGRIDDAPETDVSVLPAIREQADTIRGQVLRCRGITEQFLRFSRGIPPSIEPIDLREVVASVVSLAEPTAAEFGVTVSVEGEAKLPAVAANVEVVQHVVLNLMINAIQSCEEKGGSVTVAFDTTDGVSVRICDTGCGIPAERREHLFEPFRSQKPQGTGLGLFLSRSFMRRFKGDVRLVESELGVGSCFEIVFAEAAGGER